MTDALLSVKQVAEQLGVARGLINDHIRAGRLEAVNLGKGDRPHYRIALDKLNEFIASRTTGAPAPKPTPKRRRKRTVPASTNFPQHQR